MKHITEAIKKVRGAAKRELPDSAPDDATQPAEGHDIRTKRLSWMGGHAVDERELPPVIRKLMKEQHEGAMLLAQEKGVQSKETMELRRELLQLQYTGLEFNMKEIKDWKREAEALGIWSWQSGYVCRIRLRRCCFVVGNGADRTMLMA